MLCKGKISAVMSGGGFATVTPYNGGTVTPELVVPQSLAGVLSVGDPVVYALFQDNTGIIFEKADGAGNSSGGQTVQGEILLTDSGTGSGYCIYVSGGALMMEAANSEGGGSLLLSDCVGGAVYSLRVNDGRLTMTEAETGGHASTSYPLIDRETGITYSLYVNGGRLSMKRDGGGLSVGFTTDETLTLSPDGVLSVNTADAVEKDNTLPVTSAAVHTVVGNIEILLSLI